MFLEIVLWLILRFCSTIPDSPFFESIVVPGGEIGTVFNFNLSVLVVFFLEHGEVDGEGETDPVFLFLGDFFFFFFPASLSP